MAAKGYCTTIEVADFLGVDLTTAQTSQAENLIEEAEAYIDGETNRAWLTGAQTDETYHYPSQMVYLRYAPVASVGAVTGRGYLGADEETLTVDDDYEVRDLEAGLVFLVSPGSYERVRVDYTPVATVPADIRRACIEIVAAGLQPHLQPGSYGLDSFSLPDLTVRFARSHVQESAPPNARRILERYRYRVHA